MVASLTPQPQAVDRRRQPRSTLVCKGMLWPAAGPHRGVKVFLRDISLLGVGWRGTRPVEVGALHRLLVEAGPLRLDTTVRIMTCTPRPDGTCDVGSAFVADELYARPEVAAATSPAPMQRVARLPAGQLRPR